MVVRYGCPVAENVERRDSCRLWISGNMRLATSGVAGMLYYRLYFMDRFSGHIDHFREFEADDDGAALVLAEQWHNDHPMELWNRHRKLKRWDDVPILPE